MNPAAIRTVLNEAHRCAMAMLDNASYIERELPNVRMDAANHASAIELCSSLIGTKHDIKLEAAAKDDPACAGLRRRLYLSDRIRREFFASFQSRPGSRAFNHGLR
jgi:hypothetical protein